jgi:hypothetical protein
MIPGSCLLRNDSFFVFWLPPYVVSNINNRQGCGRAWLALFSIDIHLLWYPVTSNSFAPRTQKTLIYIPSPSIFHPFIPIVQPRKRPPRLACFPATLQQRRISDCAFHSPYDLYDILAAINSFRRSQRSSDASKTTDCRDAHKGLRYAAPSRHRFDVSCSAQSRSPPY